MQSFLHWLLTDAVPAFGRTLLHSLWQGLSAAVLAGAVVLSTRKTTASKRYALLLVIYGLFIAAVTLTFFRELGWTKNVNGPSAGLPVAISPAFVDGGAFTANPPRDEAFGNSFVAFVNQNAGLIVAVWSLLFGMQLLRMSAGLHYVKQVRRQGTAPVGGEWAGWIKKAGHRLGIRAGVTLLQSDKVKVPVAFGFFKPVVLVPVGLLTHLAPQQVEAVLLHELAHIRRYDYLVNLLQSFADAAFAFNPAVRWVSARIREARESCCDEIAVRHTGNQREYVEALVSFSESSLLPSYALAIGGNKMQLLNRVRTILTRENDRLSAREQVILVLGLVTAISVVAFSFRPKDDRRIKEPVHQKQPASAVRQAASVSLPTKAVVHAPSLPPTKHAVASDTVPSNSQPKAPVRWKNLQTNMTDDGEGKTTQVIATGEDGTVYRLRKTGGEMMLLSVNDREVAKDEYAHYRSIIDALEQSRRQWQTAALKTQQQRLAELRHQQQSLQQKLAITDTKKLNDLQERQQTLTRELAVLNTKTQLLREQAYKDYETYKADSLHQRQQYQAYKQNKQEAYQAYESYKAARPSNDAMTSLLQELKAANLIQDDSKLSFRLTNTALEVDGKAVDPATFETFRKKYIKKSGDSFEYFKNGGSTRSTINLE